MVVVGGHLISRSSIPLNGRDRGSYRDISCIKRDSSVQQRTANTTEHNLEATSSDNDKPSRLHLVNTDNWSPFFPKSP